MKTLCRIRFAFLVAVAVGPLALFFLSPAQLSAQDTAKQLLAQAERYEQQGEWGAAADLYEQVLRLDRSQTFIRDRYQYCLRRYFQVVRLRDASYQREVLTLKYPQAARLYEIVLFNLLNNALDRNRISPGLLFQKGLEEFRFALSSPEFCSDHLGGMKPDQTRGLRSMLQERFGGNQSMNFDEAIDNMRDVVMRSTNNLPKINPTAVVMEFLCGACLAVDEYTIYLTPRQLRELCATLKGRQVGVGIRLKSHDNRMYIAGVLPGSPAAQAIPPLARDEQVLAVDDKSMQDVSPEAAMDMLDGEEGSLVKLTVASPIHGVRIIVLRRQAWYVPSVQHELFGNIGHLRIHCFQETTLDEFDAHLSELLRADCKGLVLDLRGNPGGLLDVAVEIAKRFVSTGVIVSTQHQDPKQSRVYRSDNPYAITMPLVVLVDGETASCAEVLAGALKENRRGKIVGQSTYGKGSSQGLLALPGEAELRSLGSPSLGGSGAIRITIARFLSPTGQPYTGRGVEPDVAAASEIQLYQAREELHRMIGSGGA